LPSRDRQRVGRNQLGTRGAIILVCITMSGADRQRYQFGPFDVDGPTGEIRKHGLRIKLQKQPLQVLLALLERPQELVTREELRQRIWGDDTVVDFEHGLNAAVNKLRQALSDSPDTPRYVETIPGSGYRLLMPVEIRRLPAERAAPQSGNFAALAQRQKYIAV